MVSDRAFIFHIYIPWGKNLYLVPSQGHVSRSQLPKKKKKKSVVAGVIRVSQTHLDFRSIFPIKTTKHTYIALYLIFTRGHNLRVEIISGDKFSGT